MLPTNPETIRPVLLEEVDDDDLRSKVEMSLAEMGLCNRTVNKLEAGGIRCVLDLLNCTRDKLMGIPGFGEKSMDEVIGAVENLGFYRKER